MFSPDDRIGRWRREDLDHHIGRALNAFDDLPSRPHSPLGLAKSIVDANGCIDVLDVGCGTGNTLRTLRAAVLREYPGATFNGTGINDADYRQESRMELTRRAFREGTLRYDVGDAKNLPYGDAQFDLVFASDMLYYVTRPGLVVRQMLRVTRPLGHVVCNLLSDQYDGARNPVRQQFKGKYHIDYEYVPGEPSRTYLHLRHLVRNAS